MAMEGRMRTDASNNREYLLQQAYAAGVSSPKELAAFMGQMEVECGGFRSMHENLDYRGTRLLKMFPGRNGMDTLEEANTIAKGGAENVANKIYGGEWGRRNLGNSEPGDGWNFHGRGYVQLTGRANYAKAGEALGLDLVNNPDLAADRGNAAKIAVHYWQERVVKRGHQLDVDAACRDINGGTGHLPERRAAVDRWEAMLTPEVMERLALGQVALPAPSERRTAQAGPADKAWSRDRISETQDQLNRLGYTDARGEPLDIDGRWGHRTQEALARFQQDKGLPLTRIPDEQTRDAVSAYALVAQIEERKLAQQAGLAVRAQPRAQRQDLPGSAPIADAASARTTTYLDAAHPDHPLFRSLRERLPAEVADEKVAALTLQAKRAGILVARIEEAGIHGDNVFAYGRDLGTGTAVVSLSQPAPSMEDTMRQSTLFDEQQEQKRVSREQALVMAGGRSY